VPSATIRSNIFILRERKRERKPALCRSRSCRCGFYPLLSRETILSAFPLSLLSFLPRCSSFSISLPLSLSRSRSCTHARMHIVRECVVSVTTNDVQIRARGYFCNAPASNSFSVSSVQACVLRLSPSSHLPLSNLDRFRCSDTRSRARAIAREADTRSVHLRQLDKFLSLVSRLFTIYINCGVSAQHPARFSFQRRRRWNSLAANRPRFSESFPSTRRMFPGI